MAAACRECHRTWSGNELATNQHFDDVSQVVFAKSLQTWVVHVAQEGLHLATRVGKKGFQVSDNTVVVSPHVGAAKLIAQVLRKEGVPVRAVDGADDLGVETRGF